MRSCFRTYGFVILGLVLLATFLLVPGQSSASDFVIYNTYRGLNLGGAEEAPEKDFYLNMGSDQGLREGSVLKVFRRASTYDLVSQQFYRDILFPIATIKVIHVEPRASVARLEKMLPISTTPTITPRSVMVGDIVRLAEAL